MNKYLVEFSHALTPPLPDFVCWADDDNHAREQAENAYPKGKGKVIRIYELSLVWGEFDIANKW